MQLLDIFLAFVLTLAALATVVTLLREVYQHYFRLRQRRIVQTMQLLERDCLGDPKKLFEDDKDGQPLSQEDRRQFYADVLTNPAAPQAKADAQAGDDSAKAEAPDAYLARKDLFGLKHAFQGRAQRKGLYESVTLEHVLRRLLDVKAIKDYGGSNRQQLKSALGVLSARYGYMSSSVAVRFRENAQLWSFILGVLLAAALNINGLHIWETYQANPEIVAAIIAKHEDLAKGAKKALDQIEQGAEGDETMNARNRELVKGAAQQVRDLIDLKVPIGWSDEELAAMKLWQKGPRDEFMANVGNAPEDYFAWLVSVVITGLLIGIGAPFWYDLASRIAALRKGDNPAQATEFKNAGANPMQSPKEREKLVDALLNEVLGPAPEPAKSAVQS